MKLARILLRMCSGVKCYLAPLAIEVANLPGFYLTPLAIVDLRSQHADG
jgi:hypothetical protein